MTQHTRKELAAILSDIVDGNGLDLIVKALADVCNQKGRTTLHDIGFTSTGIAVSEVWSRAAKNLETFEVYAK